MIERFKQLAEQQKRALNALYRADLPLGYLIIMYTTIDMFSYIWAGGDDKQAGPRFRKFVDKYLIKHLSDVNSSDLWGARCAILHTATPDSTATQTGHARRLLYCWGAGGIETIREVIKRAPKPEAHTGVELEALEHALSEGLIEFEENLRQDPHLLSSCEPRLSKIYSIIDLSKK